MSVVFVRRRSRVHSVISGNRVESSRVGAIAHEGGIAGGAGVSDRRQEVNVPVLPLRLRVEVEV